MISKNIKQLIKKLDLNVRELARRTGIPQSTLQKIINNQSKNPRLQTLKKLADFFNVTILELTSSQSTQLLDYSQNMNLPRLPTGNIFIGVHGSSHKTEVKIIHENGNIIGIGESEPTNLHFSIKHAWDATLRAIKFALEPSGLHLSNPNYNFHIGLGLKATELISSAIEFEKAAPKYFSTIKLVSDAFITSYGAHKENGATIVIDEAVVGNVIYNGSSFKMGGWGFPHSDQGGYPWVGMQAIGFTFDWLDGKITASKLLKAIFSYFGRNKNRMIEWAMQARVYPSEYYLIYLIVVDFFKQNDVYSLEIFKNVAAIINKTYDSLLSKASLANIPCCVYGPKSIQLDDFYSNKLIKNLTIPNGTPLDGAIKMIREEEHRVC